MALLNFDIQKILQLRIKKNDNNKDEKLKTQIKSFSSIKISSVAAIGQPFHGNQGSQIDAMFDWFQIRWLANHKSNLRLHLYVCVPCPSKSYPNSLSRHLSVNPLSTLKLINE